MDYKKLGEGRFSNCEIILLGLLVIVAVAGLICGAIALATRTPEYHTHRVSPYGKYQCMKTKINLTSESVQIGHAIGLDVEVPSPAKEEIRGRKIPTEVHQHMYSIETDSDGRNLTGGLKFLGVALEDGLMNEIVNICMYGYFETMVRGPVTRGDYLTFYIDAIDTNEYPWLANWQDGEAISSRHAIGNSGLLSIGVALETNNHPGPKLVRTVYSGFAEVY